MLELNDDYLKELGVKAIGHQKKILRAVKALQENAAAQINDDNASSSDYALLELAHSLPIFVAYPLKEYVEESHPTVKLWAACDTIEMLLRLSVIIAAADREHRGCLNEKVLANIWGKIEMPTLGAWRKMAVDLLQHSEDENSSIVEEFRRYVVDELNPFLLGKSKIPTPETSFLKLRNRLAHGGGLTKVEAGSLLDRWGRLFEKIMQKFADLPSYQIVGCNKNKQFVSLIGINHDVIEINQEILSGYGSGNANGVWLVGENQSLLIWPMVQFDYPTMPSSKEGQMKTGAKKASQVYVRKENVSFQLTPFDAPGFYYSQADNDALKSFESIFKLDKYAHGQRDKGFSVRSFDKEINDDANKVIGRLEEKETIINTLESSGHSVVWLTGNAGIGKSYLMERIMRDSQSRYEDEIDTIVLS